METVLVQKEWFESWFDSSYYPLLYHNRNQEEAALFVEQLMQYFKPAKGSRVLDAGCGEGRFAHQLAQYGLNVVGIDIAASGIQKAKQIENNALDFFVHDMRKPFLVRYFDYVLNFFTSFGYFDHPRDHYLAARSFASSLKPDGIVVIDYLNKTKVIPNLVEEEIVEKHGITFHINRYFQQGKIVKEIHLQDEKGEMHHFKEEVAAFSLADFEKIFQKVGMDLRVTFGDYQLNPFVEESSERMIMVFQKIN